MCKLKKYKSSNTRLDPCMKEFIRFIANHLPPHLKLRACCCGHNKYGMTIIYQNISMKNMFLEMVNQKYIPRTRNFYKRDKQGYYYIPETIKIK